MVCLTAGFTGLTGVIWTGAQQQRMYDDLIRQTKKTRAVYTQEETDRENRMTSYESIYAKTGNHVADESMTEQTKTGKSAADHTAINRTAANHTDAVLEQQTVIDFQSLKKKNSDIVAWLTIPGTNIDYPVLQGKDNSQYLHKDMEGKESAAGSIFLDYADKKDISSLHNIFYGHHMKNGSMFKDIVKYKDQKYLKQHQEIILYTPEREIHLTAFAAVCTSPDAIRRKTDFETTEEFTSYIEEMTKNASAKIELPNNVSIRRLYSFVTCSYEFQNARTILYAYESKK